MTSTKIESAFASANLYRFLSLAFSYPTEAGHRELLAAGRVAQVAAEVISPAVAVAVRAAVEALGSLAQPQLAAEYGRVFTLSASPDCPLNECAYSAKHVYQEVQEIADIAGFYRAFGIEIKGGRPDELSAELEFCYLLALKEGIGRERRLFREANVCRRAHQTFLREHLGRWAENVGRRLAVLYPESVYAAFGLLLTAFTSAEVDRLQPGPIVPHQEVPNPPEPIDDEGCPAEEGLGASAELRSAGADYLGELTPVAGPPAREVRDE